MSKFILPPGVSSTTQVQYENHAYDGDPNMVLNSKLPNDYQMPTTSDRDSVSTDDDGRPKGCVRKFQTTTASFCRKNSSIISKLVLLLLLVAYTIYLGFAISHSVRNATALIVITSIVVFFVIYYTIQHYFGETIQSKCVLPVGNFVTKAWPYLRWFLVPAVFLLLIMYLIFEVIEEFRQLQSISGMVVIISLTYLLSKHPDKVRWRPVVVGFTMQFVMGILVLRWRPGYEAVKWLSDQITTFIGYSNEGAAAVFGDPFMLFHPFVFVGMPMLIYFGAVLSILYYFGITQRISAKMGWFFQATLGTTAIESLSVSANIFLNGMDIMLMFRPYLHLLTKSEFHTFLVGNHSTVAGFIFALFVLFGAPPEHLLSAAVMSAPACIAIAKLNYPETEESRLKTKNDINFESGQETNVVEAAASGASVAGKTVMAVVVNMLAFLSILAFINAALGWIGGRVGYPQLSFQVICSYLFWPLSILMGVEVREARRVASLLGIKVFTSEIIAYQMLGDEIDAGLSQRSAAIATYALCGFSGVSTLAIAVGVWNAVCPSKTKEMAGQMVRVIINANVSCFLTACIAGILYSPQLARAPPRPDPDGDFIVGLLNIIPGYRDIFALIPS